MTCCNMVVIIVTLQYCGVNCDLLQYGGDNCDLVQYETSSRFGKDEMSC